MSFRTIVISKRAKLNYSMGYMEVRSEDSVKIYLDDIDILLIENQSVSMTATLLSELMKKKIKVIFCDSKRNPQGELLPYYGSVDCARKLKWQIAWKEKIKEEVWTKIVKEKISNQAYVLEKYGKMRETEMLHNYIREILPGDKSNREGMAAKVYFDALFGMEFKRDDDTPTNAALNYGYSLLLSMFNREITYNGYVTQLGIFHDNVYNSYNLSSDLMEPFRVLVDKRVLESQFKQFETEEKHSMLHLLEENIEIANTSQMLPNAIRIYVRSVFDALFSEDLNKISFYNFKL